MLISFSGPQNSGKSTLLQECKTLYRERFNYVEEITRALQKKGLSINEEGNDKTQYAIMEAHILNSLYSNAILDRCSLDGLIYTNYLHNTGKVSKDLLTFAQTVFEHTIDRYDIIFYPDPNIPMNDDGIRSANTEFKDQITDIFNMFISKPPVSKKIHYLTGSIQERFTQIQQVISNFR